MVSTLEPTMQDKPIQLGENLIIRNLDDKTLITGQSRTALKEGHFLLDAEVIHIESGPGIKIYSKGKDTLVISCDLTKIDAKIFDFNARLEVVEKSLATILKILKVVNT